MGKGIKTDLLDIINMDIDKWVKSLPDIQEGIDILRAYKGSHCFVPRHEREEAVEWLEYITENYPLYIEKYELKELKSGCTYSQLAYWLSMALYQI